jgi:hypothetical protein
LAFGFGFKHHVHPVSAVQLSLWYLGTSAAPGKPPYPLLKMDLSRQSYDSKPYDMVKSCDSAKVICDMLPGRAPMHALQVNTALCHPLVLSKVARLCATASNHAVYLQQ